MRPGLIVGVNVDAVDVEAGVRFGRSLGYVSPEDQMVVDYALRRWGRGEEDGAERTWLSYHPTEYTQWKMILAHALASADPRQADGGSS